MSVRLRLQGILDSLPLGTLILDSRHRVALSNNAFARISGYPDTEIVGQHINEIIDGNGRLGAKLKRRHVSTSTRHDTALRQLETMSLVSKSGKQIPVLIEQGQVFLDDENHYVLSFKNLSHLEEIEAAIRAKQKEAENFKQFRILVTRNVNHELLTPIHGISGMMSLLKMTEMSDMQKEYLTMMEKSIKQLTAIVKTLLDYADSDNLSARLHQIPINLKSLLAVANRNISIEAKKKEIAIEFDYSSYCPVHLAGDPDKISQAYSILLCNAVKFSNQGRIRVHAFCKNEYNGLHVIRIEVEDQGIGIPSSMYDRIFDPFFQVSSATNRAYNGSGLGLTIFKQLIDLMEGRYGVRSTLDAGSLFWFEIGLPSSSLIPHSTPND